MNELLNKYVEFAEHAADALSKWIENANYSQIAILVDENTKRDCLPLISVPNNAFLIEIKSGEQEKQLTTCMHIWEQMTKRAMDRKSLLVNLGGGVIGDMGGFCAATYKRGIDFVNIPTTLLSQVDASVGGKLGIDFHQFKNHIGIFQQPNRVIISSEFLKTLAERELKSGYAEVLKHGLIADAAYWQERDWVADHANWKDIIFKSVNIKNEVVEQDPQESGLRKILNFGHTIGHAIESTYLSLENQSLLHGEAIAIGMICEAYLSFKKMGLSSSELNEIEEKIFQIYGTRTIHTKVFDQILELALQDKKNEAEKIKAVLLKKIGEAQIDVEISKEDIREALTYYNKKAEH